MQGMIRCVVVAGLLYGCGPGDTVTPVDGAGSSGTAALSIQWKAVPGDWPGDINSSVTIDEARFSFDNLRVIGDAGPGDPRTTETTFEVRWDSGTTPASIDFDNAPIGLYSQLSLQIAGRDLSKNSYELRGTVDIGDRMEFRIEDKLPMPIALSIDKMLMPNKTATVELEIDFVHALSGVDFETMDVDNGRLELNETDPEIIGFRKKLVESFKPTDGSN
ncbi:MAG: hypothetical protein HOV81_31225 [Kofleriaceae bacterium]|nr:hypothetical protein [Kofleriaceae bacterium]